MAAESNTGFRREEALGPAFSRHAFSYQSGAMNTTSEMIPMGGYFGMNTIATSAAGGGIMFPENSGIISSSSGMVQVPAQVTNSSAASSLLLDSAPGLKHDTGLAVEWSVEEQNKLQEGLDRYTDEPSIMKYIKIAASMPEKTVRDVALRCRWMTRKRRKADEFNLGKKVNNRKDKLVESSSNLNIHSVLSQNMAVYPLMMHHMDQTASLAFQGASGTTRHRLEQNAQAFSKITANLSSFKLQDNIDLFCRTRDNITAILNEMREMPGIMRQMPPLLVSINDDLANSLLPNTTQPIMFGSPTGIQLKQEPRC